MAARPSLQHIQASLFDFRRGAKTYPKMIHIRCKNVNLVRLKLRMMPEIGPKNPPGYWARFLYHAVLGRSFRAHFLGAERAPHNSQRCARKVQAVGRSWPAKWPCAAVQGAQVGHLGPAWPPELAILGRLGCPSWEFWASRPSKLAISGCLGRPSRKSWATWSAHVGHRGRSWLLQVCHLGPSWPSKFAIRGSLGRPNCQILV